MPVRRRRSRASGRRSGRRSSRRTGTARRAPAARYRSAIFDVCTFEHALVTTHDLLKVRMDNIPDENEYVNVVIKYVNKRLQEFLGLVTMSWDLKQILIGMLRSKVESMTFAWIYRFFSNTPAMSAALYYAATRILLTRYWRKEDLRKRVIEGIATKGADAIEKMQWRFTALVRQLRDGGFVGIASEVVAEVGDAFLPIMFVRLGQTLMKNAETVASNLPARIQGAIRGVDVDIEYLLANTQLGHPIMWQALEKQVPPEGNWFRRMVQTGCRSGLDIATKNDILWYAHDYVGDR